MKHGEGFKLMTYQCTTCGHSETIWNSRDGVTPFCIRCLACGRPDAQHVNWKADVYAPDHVPKKGDRVFIDLPESLKRPLALRNIERMKGTEYEVPPEEREAIVQEMIADFHPDEPFLIIMP